MFSNEIAGIFDNSLNTFPKATRGHRFICPFRLCCFSNIISMLIHITSIRSIIN